METSATTVRKAGRSATREKKDKARTFGRFVNACYHLTADGDKHKFKVYIVYRKKKAGIGARQLVCGSFNSPTIEDVVGDFAAQKKKECDKYLISMSDDLKDRLADIEQEGGLFCGKLWEANLSWGNAGSVQENMRQLIQTLSYSSVFE